MSPNTKPQEPDWKTAPLFGRRDTLIYSVRRSLQLCDKPPVIVEIGTSRDERPGACDGDGWSTRVWGWLAKETGGKSYTVDIDPEAIEACGRITAEQAEGIEYIVRDSLEFLQKWNAEERGRIDLLYLDGLDYNGGTTLREGTVRSAHGNKGNQGNADTGEGERVGADYVAEGRRSPSQAEDFSPTARGRSAAELSENHHLAASELALPHMAERCLVLFDDTYPPSEPLSPFSPLVGEGGRGDEGFQFAGKGARAMPFFLENGFGVEFVSGGQVLLSRGAEDIPANIFEDKVSNLVTQRLQAYARQRWLAMPALVTIGQRYKEFEASAEAQIYLDAVARLCGSNGSAVEIGPTSNRFSDFYVRRRNPDSTTGRWTTQDPIEYYPGGLALYRYAGNMPTIAVDPTGLVPCSVACSLAYLLEGQFSTIVYELCLYLCENGRWNPVPPCSLPPQNPLPPTPKDPPQSNAPYGQYCGPQTIPGVGGDDTLDICCCRHDDCFAAHPWRRRHTLQNRRNQNSRTSGRYRVVACYASKTN